jgi:hypothetical protein
MDAMCINQTSNDERNHQVGMTGKINAHAEEVCMWMGEMEFADQLWNPSPIEEDPGRCYHTWKQFQQFHHLNTVPEHEMLLRIAKFIIGVVSGNEFHYEYLKWGLYWSGRQKQHFDKIIAAIAHYEWCVTPKALISNI